VTENADPLLPRNKKAKTSAKLKPAMSAPKGASSSWHPSVEVKEVDNEADLAQCQRAQPTNPMCIIKASDGSDDDDPDVEPEVVDVGNMSEEELEESAEDELSK
jgi:hypothetical protein